MAGQKISTGPQLGDPEGILVGKFERASCWDNHKEFGWETENVKWLVKRMGVWLGGSKRGCHSGKRMDPSLVKM